MDTERLTELIKELNVAHVEWWQVRALFNAYDAGKEDAKKKK